MDDLAQFRDIFFQSANEHLASLSSLLHKIGESFSPAEIEQVHLHAHSLKGEAFAMKYMMFGDYITVAEKYFKKLLSTEGKIQKEKLKIMVSAVDDWKAVLDYIDNHNQEPAGLADKAKNLQNQLENTI